MGSFFSSLLGYSDSTADDSSSSSEPSSVLTLNLQFISQMATSLQFCQRNPKAYFSASWCGPCKFMEPALKEMAAKFTDVDFVKLDVDELPDVAQEFGVQAMPTFVLLKKGKEVDRVVGAKKNELEKKIGTHKTLLAAAPISFIDNVIWEFPQFYY